MTRVEDQGLKSSESARSLKTHDSIVNDLSSNKSKYKDQLSTVTKKKN